MEEPPAAETKSDSLCQNPFYKSPLKPPTLTVEVVNFAPDFQSVKENRLQKEPNGQNDTKALPGISQNPFRKMSENSATLNRRNPVNAMSTGLGRNISLVASLTKENSLETPKNLAVKSSSATQSIYNNQPALCRNPFYKIPQNSKKPPTAALSTEKLGG